MRFTIPFAIALLLAAAPLAALPLEAENPEGDDLEALLRSLWLCQDAVAVVDLNYSKALECEVSLEFTADELIIAASGVPHHDHHSGPGGQGTNGIEPQDYEWRLPLAPANDTDCDPRASAAGCELAPGLGPVAVALNGAPIFGPEDGPGGDAVATHIGQYTETEQNIWLGTCGGHSGPGGTYHYHFDANCVHWHPADGEDYDFSAVDASTHSPVIGFAFDGYPIYGSYGWDADGNVSLVRSSWLLNDGAAGANGVDDYHYAAGSGDLDACNGRFSATPQWPDGIYHYHSTPPVAAAAGTVSTDNAFPYFIYCYRGVPDLSNSDGGNGGEPPGGGPPDDDGDGVGNGWDDCADTPDTTWPDGAPLFPRGCTQAQYDAAGAEPVLDAYNGDNPPAPPDADGDGIADPEDECDDSPYGEPVYRNGCTAVQNGGGEQPPPLAEVCLPDHDNLSQHFHVQLAIYEDGVTVAVPGDIGIDTEACPGGMHAIHTHDASGTLHVELPVDGPVTLGDFFTIWGEPFSAEQVLHMVAGDDGTLAMQVDDTAVGTWGGTLLIDGQAIRVEYRPVDDDGTGDPPDDNTTTEPYPDPGDEPEPDDSGTSGLPAPSLLAAAAAVAIIALRRRRSD